MSPAVLSAAGEAILETGKKEWLHEQTSPSPEHRDHNSLGVQLCKILEFFIIMRTRASSYVAAALPVHSMTISVVSHNKPHISFIVDRDFKAVHN